MEVFSITNLTEFADSVRTGAAKYISEDYTENLDDFITIKQVENIVIQHSLGLDDDDLYIINENVFEHIFDYVSSMIYQSGLSKLAAQNLIECAWDNDTNQMIFWSAQKSIDELSI